MRIIDKIEQKSKNLWNGDIPTIAFLGDSVTQGCFEIYLDNQLLTLRKQYKIQPTTQLYLLKIHLHKVYYLKPQQNKVKNRIKICKHFIFL